MQVKQELVRLTWDSEKQQVKWRRLQTVASLLHAGRFGFGTEDEARQHGHQRLHRHVVFPEHVPHALQHEKTKQRRITLRYKNTRTNLSHVEPVVRESHVTWVLSSSEENGSNCLYTFLKTFTSSLISSSMAESRGSVSVNSHSQTASTQTGDRRHTRTHTAIFISFTSAFN